VSSERLQKVLAQAGLGSRRAMEVWIKQGVIKVNQSVAELGAKVEVGDRVRVDDRQYEVCELDEKERPRLLLYHKPDGEISTRNDPEGRKTVFHRLPQLQNGRWIAVGRLDINTSGVLLFTNSGELANRLMHPSSEIEREYAVRILGEVDETMLKNLKKGVELEDGPAKFDSIEDAGGQGSNHWYHVTLKEGRNQEVRRLWTSQGVTVSRLIRVRFGDLLLPRDLRLGKFLDVDLRRQSWLKPFLQQANAVQSLTLKSLHPRRLRARSAKSKSQAKHRRR